MPRKVFVAGEILTAADVNEFLSDQVIMTFAGTAARGSAIGTAVEGMFTYLEDSDSLEYWNGSSWEEFSSGAPIGTATPAEGSYLTYSTAVSAYEPSVGGTPSYRYVDTVYYTSNSTFTKASYPWLRAICVKVQGAGGGGGGATTTTAGQNSIGGAGGAGAYAEAFITDIAGLDASITVTTGNGGAGGAAGNNSGSTGGTSSFGTAITATGGNGGQGSTAASVPNFLSFSGSGSQTVTGADFSSPGGGGNPSLAFTSNFCTSPIPGSSYLGQTRVITSSNGNDGAAGSLGSGGCSGMNAQSQATARSGGAGGNGIVIVELYA